MRRGDRLLLDACVTKTIGVRVTPLFALVDLTFHLSAVLAVNVRMLTRSQPDSSAQSCDAAICNKPFSLFGRRHHCRRCGNVFCGVHSPFLVPLDQDAQFHPDGVLSRACEYCWSDYKGWDAVRLGRLDAVGLGQDTQTLASSATTTTTSLSIGPRPGSNAQIAGSVAGSVPRDWAWSTF